MWKRGFKIYSTSNIHKGRIFEELISKTISSLGFIVQPHHTSKGGLDLQANKDKVSIIGEAINWYGGFIHTKRFRSIIEKLSVKATIKFFFCAGVKPTKEQSRILEAMKVIVIHLPKQVLDNLGVITISNVNSINSNSYSISKEVLYRKVKKALSPFLKVKKTLKKKFYRTVEAIKYIFNREVTMVKSEVKMNESNTDRCKPYMTVQEAGRMGGNKTKATHGTDYFSEIGSKGGSVSATVRRMKWEKRNIKREE